MQVRSDIFIHSVGIIEHFMNMSDEERFMFMFNNDDMQFYIGKICFEILFKRKCILYK